jgi:hypothetical protein
MIEIALFLAFSLTIVLAIFGPSKKKKEFFATGGKFDTVGVCMLLQTFFAVWFKLCSTSDDAVTPGLLFGVTILALILAMFDVWTLKKLKEELFDEWWT